MNPMFPFKFAADDGTQATGAASRSRASASSNVLQGDFEMQGGVVSPPEMPEDDADQLGLFGRLKSIITRGQPEEKLRDALEEYIEESSRGTNEEASQQGSVLISNVIKLRDLTVIDVMIPRVDIQALEINTSREALMKILAEDQHSRLPVYRGTLDDMVGAIYIKDVIGCIAQDKPVVIEQLVREVPIVSPAMRVPDLILMMKAQRKHIAFVVDEYGGIDGMVTLGDVIEAIIGEFEDEHDVDDGSGVTQMPDGSILADARIATGDFERLCGIKLTEEEQEENDTLGGLIFSLAGRVPARGEIIGHDSGAIFEILDADPRRVKRVLVRRPVAKPEDAKATA